MRATSDRLGDRIAALMPRDAVPLRRRLERVRREPPGAGRDAAEAELEAAVAAAEGRLERRRTAVPAVSYPAELPITARRDDITAALDRHQVVIVAGETGSGKSTQLPKICLEAGRGVRGLIGHTQPRRIAARAVAERVAEEVGTEVGGSVGYAVRFTDRVGDRTLVKVMTDGILLAEIQRDRDLLAYDTIIVDEAHERSLNIDFILGYLKQLLPRRRDLKVIVTSATIDTERFAAHFAGKDGRPAPVVEVSGRTYPVEVRYRPLAVPPEDGVGDPVLRDQIEAIVDATLELCAEGPGDILVFLSGEREIRDTAEALEALDLPSTEILPLYARLSAAEQHRVFAPHRGRRIVLATNVAETSLTVPGIRAVIDPGTARISRYNRRTKVQRLPIEPVSQASANQRAGRCGRVGPGICIRLYDEDDYGQRPEFTDPEILRTSLAAVILQMAAIGLGDVARFPFIDPPDARSIADGVALLEELGAFEPAADARGRRLTPVGRRLARLPLDPRLGRMVLEAQRQGCLPEVMVIAAALSIIDPRERPTDQQAAAVTAHARFADPDSDFLSYLRLWLYLGEQAEQRSSNQFRKMCRAEFLNYLRVREWQDIYAQLRQASRDLGVKDLGEPGSAEDQESRDRIHRALLAGLLSHVGVKGSGARSDYLGARNARFAIVPDSALYKKQPRWIMAGELVETNRMWGRVVARIQPEWAEALGTHLVKRSYSEPHWDPARGTAMAIERVTLYGIPLVVNRRVSYERVDPAAARDLFIRCALVEGDWVAAHHPFVAENARLVEEVRDLEDRVRRRDILVDDEARYAFYDRRLPATVTGARAFDRWWKEQRRSEPRLLNFTRADLVNPAAGDVGTDAFPDTWHQAGHALRLSYVFDPASGADGVTVHVPIQLLEALDPAPFDWHIPGLRLELVTELIRSLPKAVRRNFVPAPDYARQALARMSPDDGPLLDVLSRRLAQLTGDAITPHDYELERLPTHLRLRFQVEDEAGRPLARSRDLDALREHLHDRVAAGIAEAGRSLERTGLRAWDFGSLPRVIDVDWAGFPVEGYPALVDEGESVGIAVFRTRDEQTRAMRAGLRRLVLLGVPSPAKAALRMLPNVTKLGLGASSYPSTAALLDDCVIAAADQLIADAGGSVWDEERFAALVRTVRARLVEVCAEIATIAGGILAVAGGVELRLERLTAPSLAPAADDMRRQLAGLVGAGFIRGAGPDRLGHMLRYLDALNHRLDKLSGPSGAARDAHLLAPIRRLQARYADLLADWPADRREEVGHIGWMIEELRVSTFAQHLGTAQAVSEPRISREIDRLLANRT
jgi:ATP-dependent helicase HrpA